MEVHAHTHTARKKWTHYFWEFLMLFLAVFCGFLAENQREHMVEHKRERQYMITLLEDLKRDTSLLNTSVLYWDTINISIDSLADAIGNSTASTNWVKAYRHINNALDYYSFKYNDRTIAQLKNAGGFRLIRNKGVATKILAYDQFNNDAVVNIKDQHNSFFETVIQLRNKVFAQKIINELFDRFGFAAPPISQNSLIDSMLNKNKSPLSPESQSISLFEFKNALLGYRKDFSNMNYSFNNLRTQMNALIELIMKEYRLE